MKKQIYIFCAMILGVLLTTILHAFLEMWYISLFVANPAKYGLGLSWSQILMVHYIYTALFLVLGIVGGYFLGQEWWRIVYVEKRYWRFKKNQL